MGNVSFSNDRVTFIAISKDHFLNLNKINSGDTGVKAIHPLTKKQVPIHVCDYVISDFGEGAVMGVPAHDPRDFKYAKENNLEIIVVLDEEKNIMINSEQFNGLTVEQGLKKIKEYSESLKIGNSKTEYKLRDWLISRQRYWVRFFNFYEIGMSNTNVILS